jgi:hypothetical protein
LAEMVWDEGWSFEIGQPFYNVRHISNPFKRSVPIMDIPISVFFSSSRLAEIFAKTGIAWSDHGVEIDSDGLQINEDNVSGSSQLFVEHFFKPRRVFVRALNELGDVLALFSDWTWRTDKIIHNKESQRVFIAVGPKPFIKGFAKFPVHWVEWEGSQVSFDVVVAPVPDEQVIVKVEVLSESEEGKKEFEGHVHSEEALLQDLGKWIQLRWTPSIFEGLPIAGYLPGNKRTAVGVLHIKDGTIVRVQFQNGGDDPFFLKSLDELESNLLGSCVLCQDQAGMLPSSSRFSETFRLQLTLMKDTHFLQLGNSPR